MAEQEFSWGDRVSRELTGHASGRRIVALLCTKKNDLDWGHDPLMR